MTQKERYAIRSMLPWALRLAHITFKQHVLHDTSVLAPRPARAEGVVLAVSPVKCTVVTITNNFASRHPTVIYMQ